VKMVLSY